ncbi:MAG TPA: cytochrome c [Candidatus Acidoferrum sp.]|nr:cytochrome c [Candidatus Acidoferrum sp.]
MSRITIFSAGVLFLGLAGGFTTGFARPKAVRSQDPPAAEAPIPAEDAAKKNPVKPAPEGMAEARKLFGYHCAMCHGKDGDGKGDLAADMKLQLKDWRDPNSLAKMTDGELFYIITNGRGKMTGGEGDRTKEEVRWNLVNVVRAFAKKDAAAKP